MVTFSLRYYKDNVNFSFRVPWAFLATQTQSDTLGFLQLVENLCVYLQAKNQLYPLCFSGDISKMYKFLILGTLGMPGCRHRK